MFRVEIKIRNAALYNAIMSCGYKTVAEFCKANDIEQTLLSYLLSFRISPLSKKGTWKQSALKVATALNVLPDEIFPEAARIILEKNKSSFDVNREQMELLSRNPFDLVADKSVAERVKQLMGKALTDREQKILRLHFGFDGEEYTMNEIGDMFGVTPGRVRQIEIKAMRKLRHPNVSSDLKELM
jgi:RNA polymerase sigma factor (sigma-70 family)